MVLIQCSHISWSSTPVQFSFLSALRNVEFTLTFLDSSCSHWFPVRAFLCLRSLAYCFRLGNFGLTCQVVKWGEGAVCLTPSHSLTVLQHVFVAVGFFHFLFLNFPVFPQGESSSLHQRKLGSKISSHHDLQLLFPQAELC